MIQRVSTCTNCHNRADYNTPALDPQGNLWCDRCAHQDESGTVFRGVEQILTEAGNYEPSKYGTIYHNRVVVWNDMAWFNGGSVSCPLTTDEREQIETEEGRITVAKTLAQEWADGIRRCTSCHKRMTAAEVAGRPLFAGQSCASCWERHKRQLEAERRAGHVCRMCRRPYSDCCC